MISLNHHQLSIIIVYLQLPMYSASIYGFLDLNPYVAYLGFMLVFICLDLNSCFFIQQFLFFEYL